MEIIISQQQFEGPLDLLLTLIKKNKLDLLNLDLTLLTQQYINTIKSWEARNLDIASEYLIELANLLQLKSRELLPQVKETEVVDNDSEETLIQRLIEYDRYQQASQLLAERFIERQQQFGLPMQLTKNVEITYQHDVYDLIKAMSKLMARKQRKDFKQVNLQIYEYSVEERIDDLRKQLAKCKNSFSLYAIFEDDKPLSYNIATFLAVLDMIRMQEIFFILADDDIILKGAYE